MTFVDHETTVEPRQPATAGDGARPSPARRRPSRHGRAVGSRFAAWAFLLPLVAYLLAFYAYPMYKNVELSTHDYTVRTFVFGGAPFSGFDNYRAIFDDPTFVPALTHTLIFTFVSIAVQFSIGLALAVFFAHNFRLSGVLRALFLVPWLLPLIVSASTWAWMLDSESGVINSLIRGLGGENVDWLTSPTWSLISVLLANIWIGIPFNLVLLYSGLQAIPAEMREAASLDGAGAWKSFWYVTFPLLRPVASITLLLGFVYTLKVFDIIWVMTKGGPDGSSTTLATWSYQLGFGSLVPRFGPSAAVGNVLILMAVVAGLGYIRVQRRQEAS